MWGTLLGLLIGSGLTLATTWLLEERRERLARGRAARDRRLAAIYGFQERLPGMSRTLRTAWTRQCRLSSDKEYAETAAADDFIWCRIHAARIGDAELDAALEGLRAAMALILREPPLDPDVMPFEDRMRVHLREGGPLDVIEERAARTSTRTEKLLREFDGRSAS